MAMRQIPSLGLLEAVDPRQGGAQEAQSFCAWLVSRLQANGEAMDATVRAEP